MPPGSVLRIRPYVPEDYRAVVRLWKRSGIEVGPSDVPAEIERARRRDPGLFLVAVQGARRVGVVLGRFDGRLGWIHHLAVDPAHRGRGLGRRLVLELERRLARAGCPKVNLHVLRSNAAVVPFYERLGYGTRDLLFLDKWLRGAPIRPHRGRYPRDRGESRTPDRPRTRGPPGRPSGR